VVSEHLSAARAALARGDVLAAYDDAMAASEVDPSDLEAPYVAALALVRSGASERAAEAATALRRRVEQAGDVTDRLSEDIDALDARIAKDRALASEGAARTDRLREAADRYEAVADRYGRYYACINAATLRLLAGDIEEAHALARRVRTLLQAEPPPEDDEYWRAATAAEAALVLGEPDVARAALERAVAVAEDDTAARAASRRQLALVCAATGIDPEILDALGLPTVVHYCGHVSGANGTAGRLPGDDEARVASEVGSILDARDAGIAYGSLASGSDIIVAEAVLAAGGELHVVLPFAADEFEAVSVRPAGDQWVLRFRACLAQARSVIQACDSAYLGDDTLFEYASHTAMGHARNRAAALGTDAVQIAVWDGLPARGPGGTADDVAVWERAGGSTHVVRVGTGLPAPDPVPPTGRAPSPRSVRAILFADLHGFSRLRDEQFPTALDEVFTPLAGVLARFPDDVLWTNSWGDAVQVMFRDVCGAARAALGLQEAMRAIDLGRAGLPAEFALRVAVHAGPVLKLRDPFRGTEGWWGRELTRAARIEPRTPEGEVYATSAFAALLALRPEAGLACEYVGRVTTAKDFETIPMYRVRAQRSLSPEESRG
jgi:hypothetical protein